MNHYRELQQYLIDMGLPPSKFRLQFTTKQEFNYLMDKIDFDCYHEDNEMIEPKESDYLIIHNEVYNKLTYQSDFDLDNYIDNCIDESQIDYYQLYHIETGLIIVSSYYETFIGELNLFYPEQFENYKRSVKLKIILDE